MEPVNWTHKIQFLPALVEFHRGGSIESNGPDVHLIYFGFWMTNENDEIDAAGFSDEEELWPDELEAIGSREKS